MRKRVLVDDRRSLTVVDARRLSLDAAGRMPLGAGMPEGFGSGSFDEGLGMPLDLLVKVL